MTVSISYAQIKAALTASHYPTSSGSAWQGTDAGSYLNLLGPSEAYAAGAIYDARYAAYGVAYPAAMPTAIANAVQQAAYSATLAASPLTATHAVTTVTFTLTEQNVSAGATLSYSWDFGDGSSHTTTSVPTTTYIYPTAGTYTPKCTPTLNGTAKAQVTAAAPVVVS